MKLNSSILAVAAGTVAYAQSNITCQSGAHIIVARASTEPPGFGILGAVKDQILQRLPNSDAIPVPYPATLAGDPIYPVSEGEGVGNLTLLVKQYGDACPSSKMVLMGYSQGAQVVGDTLIGSDYLYAPIFANTTGIDQKYINNVVAVIMMGDPANVAGQPFLVGNSTKNGTFPRNNTANWATAGLDSKIQSYCDFNDTFCAQGSSIPVHLSYISVYGNQAADFVVSKVTGTNSTNSTGSNSTSSTASTSSATSTPSSTTSTGGSGTSGSGSASSPSASHNGADRYQLGMPVYLATGLVECVLFLALTL